MTKTILLADDSVTIQKVVELTFMDEDCSVVAVSNGAQALTKLAELTPDLVIADIHMPGADGYEVCRQVKATRPRVPVLLLVGTFEPFEAADVSAAGADGYLKKPFDSQELLRRVNELLTRGPVAVSTPAPAPTPVPEPRTETLKVDLQTLEASAQAPWTAPPASTPAFVAPPTPPPAWAVRAPEPAAPEPATEEIATGWEMAPEEPEPEPAPAPTPVAPTPVAPAFPPPASAAAEPAAVAAGNGQLSDADVDRIARRVVELIGERIVREVAWEVVPDLAEVVLKARIRELESQVE